MSYIDISKQDPYSKQDLPRCQLEVKWKQLIIDHSRQYLCLEQDLYSDQDPPKHLCLTQVKLLLTNLSKIASTEKKDGENHSFKSDGEYEVSQESDPETKLHTYTTIINNENWLHCSIYSSITCSQYKGSDRIFSILIEYG